MDRMDRKATGPRENAQVSRCRGSARVVVVVGGGGGGGADGAITAMSLAIPLRACKKIRWQVSWESDSRRPPPLLLHPDGGVTLCPFTSAILRARNDP